MKDFDLKLTINASKEEVYAALTNKFQIELWTGHPAVMDDQVGTEFSLWGGDISGINIEMREDYKIVQEWFFGETENPSIVTIILKKEAKSTILTLNHTNIPSDAYDEILVGWKEYYLDSVRSFLEFY